MFYNNYYAKQNTDERIWVQNKSSAESYLVAPNGFVRLWDTNEPVFYEKRADATGRPLPMETFKYERLPTQPNDITPNTLQEQIDGIIKRLDVLEKGVINDTEPNADDSTV